MFASGKLIQLSVGLLINQYPILEGSTYGLTRKHDIRPVRLAREKHSSLFGTFRSEEKKFCENGTCSPETCVNRKPEKDRVRLVRWYLKPA